MHEHEKRIKEQRTIEASRKGLMGLGGKFGLIVKFLGQPILGDASMFDSSYMNLDPNQYIENPKEPGYGFNDGPPEYIQSQMPYMEDRDEPTGYGWRESRDGQSIVHVGSSIMGWHFDGLSRGMHLEIRYLEDEKELLVQYEGYPVYREVAGDLNCYAPKEEWENKVDKLYQSAKILEQKRSKSGKIERIEEAETAKEHWWDRIKTRWGL